MKRSDWITITGMVVSILITTIGSALYLAFKVGGINELVERIPRMEADIGKIRVDVNDLQVKVGNLQVKVSDLQVKVDNLQVKVDDVEQRMTDMDFKVNQIQHKMTEMDVKVDALWRRHLLQTSSVLVLDEAMLKALESTGIGKYAHQHYRDILSSVRAIKPENASQTEEVLISVVGGYKKADDFSRELRKAASSSGYDIDSLLFAAAWSLRDRVMRDLGF
jgi:hypothetical protein